MAGMSDIPHGLISSIILFNINNMDKGTEGSLSKFADDIKLGRAGDMLEGRAATERDFNNLEEHAGRKHAMFNKKQTCSCASVEITPWKSTSLALPG